MVHALIACMPCCVLVNLTTGHLPSCPLAHQLDALPSHIQPLPPWRCLAAECDIALLANSCKHGLILMAKPKVKTFLQLFAAAMEELSRMSTSQRQSCTVNCAEDLISYQLGHFGRRCETQGASCLRHKAHSSRTNQAGER